MILAALKLKPAFASQLILVTWNDRSKSTNTGSDQKYAADRKLYWGRDISVHRCTWLRASVNFKDPNVFNFQQRDCGKT